jgi:hypothetical protein
MRTAGREAQRRFDFEEALQIHGAKGGIVANPRKTLHLYLLGGQSNMAGYGGRNKELPENFEPPFPGVPIFANGSWGDLRPGLGHEPEMFGPEVSFGRAIHRATPERNVALVKYAVGGTNLYADWRPRFDAPNAPPPGPQYQGFIQTMIDALRTLPKETDVVFAGMIWMQGESDSTVEEMARAYHQNLADFIQRIREEVQTPDLPFALGLIAPFPSASHYDIVRQAQEDVARLVPNTIAFPTDDLSKMADELHYDTGGTLALGERFAEHLERLPGPADQTPRDPRSFDLVTSAP